MLTLKLKISNGIDVSKHCENYSYMFRKLYANFELSKDKNFQKELRTKYNLDSWIFESCRMDAETKLKQMETFAEKRNAELIGLENDLQNQYDFLSENFGKEGQLKARRSISRILKKIRTIKSSKGLIVFGGKPNLQKISYLSNVKQLEEAQKWREVYQKNRILPINVVGEMLQKGNRKTKNIWHRELTTNLITKYCNILGIEKIEVNPCYSSFIGNIQHNYFDPLNAALEIARRGKSKYTKGAFYPSLERTDFDTMYRLGLDVQNSTVTNWQEALKLFKNAGLRYRRELMQTSFSEINLFSEKSCTSLYNFI